MFVLGSGFGSRWFLKVFIGVWLGSRFGSTWVPHIIAQSSIVVVLFSGLVPLGSGLSTNHRQTILHGDCAWSLPTALAINSRVGHMKNDAVSGKQQKPIP